MPISLIHERPDLLGRIAGSPIGVMPKIMTPGSANADAPYIQAERIWAQLQDLQPADRIIEIEGALACARLRDDPVPGYRHPEGSTWTELKAQYRRGRWAFNKEAEFVRDVLDDLHELSQGALQPGSLRTFINFEGAHDCDWGHNRGLDVGELLRQTPMREPGASIVARTVREENWYIGQDGKLDRSKLAEVNAWFANVGMRQARLYLSQCGLQLGEAVLSFQCMGELARPVLNGAAMPIGHLSVDAIAPANHQCFGEIHDHHRKIADACGMHPAWIVLCEAIDLAFAAKFAPKGTRRFCPTIWPGKMHDIELQAMLAGWTAAGNVHRVMLFSDGDTLPTLEQDNRLAGWAGELQRRIKPDRYWPAGVCPKVLRFGGFAISHEEFVSEIGEG